MSSQPPSASGDGVDVLREGGDISVFASGQATQRALEAAQDLYVEDGVEVEVVDVSIVRPLAERAVVGSLTRTGVGVIAAEESGGLGDAIRKAAAERHPVPILACDGADALGIAAHIREALLLKPIVSRPPIHGAS
jgi:transketolase C-terminal domain/subunit